MDNPNAGPGDVGGDVGADKPERGTLDAAIDAEMRAMERATGRPQGDDEAPPRKAKQQPQDATQESGEGPDNASGEEGEQDPEQADPDKPDPDDPDASDAGDEAGDDRGEAFDVEGSDGKTYRVPKALQGQLMMREDYTRKTTQLAQHAAQVESDRQQVRALYDASGPYLAQVGEYNAIKAEHDRLMNTTNFAQLEATDLVEYARVTGKIGLLANRMGQLQQGIQTTQSELQRQSAEEAHRRVEQATQVMAQIWPDFKRQDAARLGEFGRACGMKAETIAYLDQGHDPVAMRLLDFAFNHVMAIRNKPAALKKVADARPAVRVGAATAGNQNRGAQNVAKFSKRLAGTGSVHDAIALEMSIEQRGQQRRRR